MKFVKMHGAGNDFMIFDAFRNPAAVTVGRAAEALCRRHYGVGADGVILVGPSGVASARMVIYNSDGSLAEMCGNGLRCAARYLYDTGRAGKSMTVETGAGILRARVENDDGLITTWMGRPRFEPGRIPLLSETPDVSIVLGGKSVRFDCASMGNPHAVALDYFPERELFLKYGPQVETNPRFPNKANVEFCRVLAEDEVEIRVWERGDGETLACGTGAAATFAVGRKLGRLAAECRMRLPGGTLIAREEPDGEISLTGTADYTFRGEVELG